MPGMLRREGVWGSIGAAIAASYPADFLFSTRNAPEGMGHAILQETQQEEAWVRKAPATTEKNTQLLAGFWISAQDARQLSMSLAYLRFGIFKRSVARDDSTHFFLKGSLTKTEMAEYPGAECAANTAELS